MTDHEPPESSAELSTGDVQTADDLATAMPDIDVHNTESDPRTLAPLLANTALALAVLAGVELLLTIALGLSIRTEQLSRVSRIGYAFLTQLEKSPLGLLLVGAAILVAIAARWAAPKSSAESRVGLAAGLVLGFAVMLAIATILALIARFDVGDIVVEGRRPQLVDGVARRVLAIFVLRNLGAAAVALVVAGSAVRARPRA